MKLKGILKALSPTLVNVATSSNPLAGMVVKMAAKKLGMPDNSSLEEIEETVEREPEKAPLLAQTESELKAMEIKLETFKAENEDVQDARSHFSEDWTPKAFSILALVLYGAYVMIVTMLPFEQNETIISLVLGQLSGILGTCAAFFYGNKSK